MPRELTDELEPFIGTLACLSSEHDQAGLPCSVLLQAWVQPLDGWVIERIGARLFIPALSSRRSE
jgi:hypothetical protein